MKELVSDKIYEKSMLKRLDQSRQLIQNMVDEWHKLGYRNCTSESQLYDLAFNYQAMIDEGKALKEMDGDGLPKEQKEAYLQKLKFKNPHHFKVAAHEVEQDVFSERGQGLWSIKDGVISLNTKAADEILKARSVIAQTKGQEELGEKILQLRDIFNSVNQQTYGALKMNVDMLFTKPLRANTESDPVVLDIEVFRRLLSFA